MRDFPVINALFGLVIQNNDPYYFAVEPPTRDFSSPNSIRFQPSAGHVGHAGLCPCGGPKGGGATGAGSTGGAGTKATTFGSEAVIEATVWVLRMTIRWWFEVVVYGTKNGLKLGK